MPTGFTSKRVFLPPPPPSDRIGRLEYEKETIYSKFSGLQRGFNLDVTDTFQLLLAFIFSKGHCKCCFPECCVSPESCVLCLPPLQAPDRLWLSSKLKMLHSTISSPLTTAAEGPPSCAPHIPSGMWTPFRLWED